MRTEKLRSRDEFEYWLFDMDDAIEAFLDGLPAQIYEKLDFTPASLDILEALLLERYPTVESMLDRYQSLFVDDVARYVGETLRRTIGGYWDIDLDNLDNAFFGRPVLAGYMEHATPISPHSLVTAAGHRRIGTFLHTLVERHVEQVQRARAKRGNPAL
ncbi:MAG TPA: hypothetical protein VKY74_17780 [Chloroflexia bacterium]|nr:hypothetical protein [Chloroflexia bacterium]